MEAELSTATKPADVTTRFARSAGNELAVDQPAVQSSVPCGTGSGFAIAGPPRPGAQPAHGFS